MIKLLSGSVNPFDPLSRIWAAIIDSHIVQFVSMYLSLAQIDFHELRASKIMRSKAQVKT